MQTGMAVAAAQDNLIIPPNVSALGAQRAQIAKLDQIAVVPYQRVQSRQLAGCGGSIKTLRKSFCALLKQCSYQAVNEAVFPARALFVFFPD